MLATHKLMLNFHGYKYFNSFLLGSKSIISRKIDANFRKNKKIKLFV
jgi:hypothetical protein